MLPNRKLSDFDLLSGLRYDMRLQKVMNKILYMRLSRPAINVITHSSTSSLIDDSVAAPLLVSSHPPF